MGGQSVLLLRPVRRRTGQTRTTPVQYLPTDGAFVVGAANAGAPRPPAWYLNLRAAPHAAVRIGTKDIEVQAREVHDSERDAMWRDSRLPTAISNASPQGAGSAPVLVLGRPGRCLWADRVMATVDLFWLPLGAGGHFGALAAPIAIALLPLLAPSRRPRPVGHGAAAAMTLFALVTGFTIGTPYLLPAALVWIASSGPSARPGTATV